MEISHKNYPFKNYWNSLINIITPKIPENLSQKLSLQKLLKIFHKNHPFKNYWKSLTKVTKISSIFMFENSQFSMHPKIWGKFPNFHWKFLAESSSRNLGPIAVNEILKLSSSLVKYNSVTGPSNVGKEWRKTWQKLYKHNFHFFSFSLWVFMKFWYV